MQLNRQHNKYGNTRTAYNGRVFHSKKEAQHAAMLDMLKNAISPHEKVVNIEYQVKILCKVGDIHVCNYIADFVVTYGDGRTEVHDVKGFKTDIYKLKKKLVKAVHGIDILEF